MLTIFDDPLTLIVIKRWGAVRSEHGLPREVVLQLAEDDWDSSDVEADDEAEEGGVNSPTSPTLPSSPPPTSPVRQVSRGVTPSHQVVLG